MVNEPREMDDPSRKVAVIVMSSSCPSNPPRKPLSVIRSAPASMLDAKALTFIGVVSAEEKEVSGPPAKKFAPPPIAAETDVSGNPLGAPYCTTVKLLVVNQPGMGSTSLPEPLPVPASASPLVIRFVPREAGAAEEGDEAKARSALPDNAADASVLSNRHIPPSPLLVPP
jgi:hypothetical protein